MLQKGLKGVLLQEILDVPQVMVGKPSPCQMTIVCPPLAG